MVHYSYPTASCQTETLRLWVKGNGYKNTRNTCLVMSYCNRATALYRQNAVNSNGVGGALLGAVPKGLWKVRHILRFAHVTRHAVGDSLLRALTRTNIRTVANDLTQLETGSTCVRLMGRSRGSIVVAHDTITQAH